MERLLERTPTREALLVPLLHLAEEEFRVLDDDALEWVSRQTGIPFAAVLETVSFHGSLRRKAGHVIRVCRTLSCAFRGAAEVRSRIETRLGIRAGETTSDGRFRLQECECLGACLGAPALLVDGERHEVLSVERIDAILEGLL
jgi:NADH-quinone oxidoreductase subunit E